MPRLLSIHVVGRGGMSDLQLLEANSALRYAGGCHVVRAGSESLVRNSCIDIAGAWTRSRVAADRKSDASFGAAI